MNESRDRIKKRAAQAAENLTRHHAGETLSAYPLLGLLVDLGTEAAASWQDYHEALAACPITASPDELAALYAAHDAAIKALVAGMWGAPKITPARDPFAELTEAQTEAQTEAPTELQQ